MSSLTCRYFNETELIESETIKIVKKLDRNDQMCTLIMKMTTELVGTYKVQAVNTAGEATCTAQLTMQGKYHQYKHE